MIPACVDVCGDPDGGFKSADDVDSRVVELESREPCNFCFPAISEFQEIDEDFEDLVVSMGKYSASIHRHKRTGKVDFGERQAKREQKTLAEKVRDGEFPAAGGDA